jgi:hypothetical protein
VAWTLLQRIEAYLKLTGMAQSRFGRLAVRDPLFVAQLRRGRRARAATEEKVRTFLESAERPPRRTGRRR